MSDPFHWTIQLGRWAGVRVRIHLILILFAVLALLNASLVQDGSVRVTLTWLGLLLLVLLLHELGHVLAALRLNLEPEEIRLWPLGNLTVPLSPPAMRSPEGVIVAASGLAVSLALALATALLIHFTTTAEMVFNPFGSADGGGAPLGPDDKPVAAFTAVWFLGWFGYLNWVVFLANLIPALPFDGGRIFRGLVENSWGGGGRDPLVGPVTARVCAILVGLLGIVLMFKGVAACWALMALAIFIYIMARLESRLVEEGEFFDDSLFGYDFSQGYTSLDGDDGARPAREGALRRWRRRRSELRRQRQQAREAAEETRLDSVLDKLHREGRAALTPEENRFLIRVSAKLKNRSKSRG
jgi:Zn-dependent protease